MAGGSDDALERAAPIFDVLGQSTTHVGPVGTGQVAKAANQVIVGLNIGAVAEALVLARKADFKLLREEIFGPVLTVYVYKDSRLDHALELCDRGSAYGLTGAIFARDRSAIVHMTEALTHAAGNFYINDKPTGAVVGQQPFGGGRASGTNDKAGSVLNLVRWVSPRTIKETFVPPTHFAYPYMQPEPDE